MYKQHHNYIKNQQNIDIDYISNRLFFSFETLKRKMNLDTGARIFCLAVERKKHSDK